MPKFKDSLSYSRGKATEPLWKRRHLCSEQTSSQSLAKSREFRAEFLWNSQF